MFDATIRGVIERTGGDFCGIVVLGQRYFPYYSYRRKTTERECFVPTRTLIGVKLLTINLFKCLEETLWANFQSRFSFPVYFQELGQS